MSDYNVVYKPPVYIDDRAKEIMENVTNNKITLDKRLSELEQLLKSEFNYLNDLERMDKLTDGYSTNTINMGTSEFGIRNIPDVQIKKIIEWVKDKIKSITQSHVKVFLVTFPHVVVKCDIIYIHTRLAYSNIEKYCCNCEHWRGTIEDVAEFEKCYKHKEIGYFERTRFDEYCNEFELSDDYRPYDLKHGKKSFGFNPKEFIPKG